MKTVPKFNSVNLAIVIPAYKAVFFRETLQSIADQSCKRFHVYVGDDGSPDDLKTIILEFENKIPLTYQKFDHNLGRYDLVAHWERCIDMVQNEQWIWFFSDDDLMDPTCVEKFYSNFEQFKKKDIVHFNVKKINSDSKVIENGRFQNYPSSYLPQDFCRDRLICNQQSYFVEFIFKKSKFMEVGRCQRFDLAWGSDVATCIKLGTPGGIATISGPYVYWRKSNHNISPDKSSEMVNRKLSAVVSFLEWLIFFFREQGEKLPVSPVWIYLRRGANYRGKISISRTFVHLLRLIKTNLNLFKKGA